MDVDVRMICGKFANFFRKRVMAAVTCAVDEPNRSAAVLRGDRMQDAHHRCQTDAGADENERTDVAGHHEITGRTATINNIA